MMRGDGHILAPGDPGTSKQTHGECLPAATHSHSYSNSHDFEDEHLIWAEPSKLNRFQAFLVTETTAGTHTHHDRTRSCQTTTIDVCSIGDFVKRLHDRTHVKASRVFLSNDAVRIAGTLLAGERAFEVFSLELALNCK